MKHSTERLQKVMARAGLGSRRALEAEIESGQVMVNQSVASLGLQVKSGDVVSYQGRRYKVLEDQPQQRTLVYFKPEGELTTRHDPEGRKTVFDRLPHLTGARWIAIGRLDINTQGLLLLTTDGELAHQMMHPSSQIDREYLCRIRGEVAEDQLEQLRQGVILDDGPAKFSDVVIGERGPSHTWVTVTLMEGRNREVRRLWEAVGAQVARLKRVRYGPVFLPKGLRSGRYEELTARDHQILREDAGLSPQQAGLILVPERHAGGRSETRLARPNHRKKRNSRRH